MFLYIYLNVSWTRGDPVEVIVLNFSNLNLLEIFTLLFFNVSRNLALVPKKVIFSFSKILNKLYYLE